MQVKTKLLFWSVWCALGDVVQEQSDDAVFLLQKHVTKLHSDDFDDTETQLFGFKRCYDVPKGMHSGCKIVGGGKNFAKTPRQCAEKAKKIGADTFTFLGKGGRCWLRKCRSTDLQLSDKPKKPWGVFSVYCGLESVHKDVKGPCGLEKTTYLKYRPPPTHACEAPLNFANGMKGNNLNGLGPGSGAKSMRFREILPGVDLQVKATDSYRPANTKKNGRYKKWGGSVNLLSGTNTDFSFSFLNSTGRNKVKVDSFMFTVFDLDQSKACVSRTKVEASGYSGYYLADDTELLIKTTPPQENRPAKTVFESTSFGNARDNPKDPLNMTVSQARRAVTFVYQNVKTFYMGFGLTGGEKSGRNIIFGGSSSITNSLCNVAEGNKRERKAKEQKMRKAMRPKHPELVPKEKVRRAGAGDH